MSFALFEDGTTDVCRPQVPHAVNMIGRLRRPCCDWFLPHETVAKPQYASLRIKEQLITKNKNTIFISFSNISQ